MTWEQRWHPLRQEWVVIAAHRQDRPWTTEQVKRSSVEVPRHDDACHLCPGNRRVSGVVNERYSRVFVFDNDHPCVGPEAPLVLAPATGIYRSAPARGLARVVCYTPRHDLSLAELELEQLLELLQTWQYQYRELAELPGVSHVLTFENKGEVVGVSNPHPHGQIYATSFVFKTTEIELAAERAHLAEHRRGLFEQIIEAEQDDGRRILAQNTSAIAFVPYFARYAYEAYVAPKRRHPSIAALSDGELLDLALVLKQLLVRFDNLWCMPFPYVMVLHQAPTDGADHGAHHFHIQFHPPLRKPHLLKYLAGPELGGGGFISDTSPEEKAHELRSVPLVHYKQAAPHPRGVR